MARAYVPPHLRRSENNTKKLNNNLSIDNFPLLGAVNPPKQDKSASKFDFKAAANQEIPEIIQPFVEILPGWVKLSKYCSPIENKVEIPKEDINHFAYSSEEEIIHYEISEKMQKLVDKWEMHNYHEYVRNGYNEFYRELEYNKDDYESDSLSEESDSESESIDDEREAYNDFDLLDKRFMTK